MLNSLVPWLVTVVLRNMKRKDDVPIITTIIKIFCKMIQMKILAFSSCSCSNVMENAINKWV